MTTEFTVRQALTHLVACEWSFTEFEDKCPGHVAAKARVGVESYRTFTRALYVATLGARQEATQ